MSGRLTITGRADLLRALMGAEHAAAQQRLGAALGFDFVPPLPARIESTAPEQPFPPPREAEPVAPVLEARVPLQTSFFALTGYRKLSQPTPEEAEAERATRAAAEAVQPLTDKDCEPTGLPLPFQPLVRRERLWPRLRQSLQQRWAAGLDLPRLVGHLSRGELPRSLPARRHSGLTAQVFVLWDAADRLTPYAEDYRRLIAELHHLHGAAGLRLWRVHDGPDEVWGEWAPERVAWPERWPGRSWRKESPGPGGIDAGLPAFPAGSRVLLLSDLGGLARHTAPARRWLRALRRWRTEGVSSTAWVPQGPRWVAPALVAQADEVHCLTPTPQRVRAAGPTDEDSLTTHLDRHRPRHEDLCDELLVRASICIHLEPALLRSLRHTLPAPTAEPGLEALAWSAQPKVRSSRLSRALAPEFAPAYRKRFAALPAPAQHDVLRCVTEAHACLGRSTAVTEVLVWGAYADVSVQEEWAKDEVEKANTWVKAWNRRVEGEASRGALAIQTSTYASDLIARTTGDVAFVRFQPEWVSRLWALSGATTVLNGLQESHARAAIKALGGSRSSRVSSWSIDILDRVVGFSRSENQTEDHAIHFEDETCWFHKLPSGAPRMVRNFADLDLPLMRAGSPGQRLKVSGGGQVFEVAELVRPDWASEWGKDAAGLFATLVVKDQRLRFRYIRPGAFLMGTQHPKTEFEKEAFPQHAVNISTGFWFSEACCSRAMWNAVMGLANGEVLVNSEYPATNISWYDVSRFVGKIRAAAPKGTEIGLPTEARWEYAQRTLQRRLRGEFTIPPEEDPTLISSNSGDAVYGSSISPYWEWCLDSGRLYSTGAIIDPDGGQRGIRRVKRGTRGFFERKVHAKVNRSSDTGFRLVVNLNEYESLLDRNKYDPFSSSVLKGSGGIRKELDVSLATRYLEEELIDSIEDYSEFLNFLVSELYDRKILVDYSNWNAVRLTGWLCQLTPENVYHLLVSVASVVENYATTIETGLKEAIKRISFFAMRSLVVRRDLSHVIEVPDNVLYKPVYCGLVAAVKSNSRFEVIRGGNMWVDNIERLNCIRPDVFVFGGPEFGIGEDQIRSAESLLAGRYNFAPRVARGVLRLNEVDRRRLSALIRNRQTIEKSVGVFLLDDAPSDELITMLVDECHQYVFFPRNGAQELLGADYIEVFLLVEDLLRILG